MVDSKKNQNKRNEQKEYLKSFRNALLDIRFDKMGFSRPTDVILEKIHILQKEEYDRYKPIGEDLNTLVHERFDVLIAYEDQKESRRNVLIIFCGCILVLILLLVLVFGEETSLNISRDPTVVRTLNQYIGEKTSLILYEIIDKTISFIAAPLLIGIVLSQLDSIKKRLQDISSKDIENKNNARESLEAGLEYQATITKIIEDEKKVSDIRNNIDGKFEIEMARQEKTLKPSEIEPIDELKALEKLSMKSSEAVSEEFVLGLYNEEIELLNEGGIWQRYINVGKDVNEEIVSKH